MQHQDRYHFYRDASRDMTTRWTLLRLLLLTTALHLACPDEVDLYNTDELTDYEWTTFSKFGTPGWRQHTVTDRGRTKQVHTSCDVGSDNVENWVRLPYIPRGGANQVLIELDFSVRKCQQEGCRQNFELYLYESDSGDKSAWSVQTLKLISLVTARSTYNGTTLPTHALDRDVIRVPVTKAGFFISVVDRGACVTLHRLLVFYLQCPNTTANMANFPATAGGSTMESEVLVLGRCVEHAVPQQPGPSALCQHDGQLVYFQGSCACVAGYQEGVERPNTCVGCPEGQYKHAQGTHLCSRCPDNSHSGGKGAKVCPCLPGFVRDLEEEPTAPCRPGAPGSGDVRTTEEALDVHITEYTTRELHVPHEIVTERTQTQDEERYEDILKTTPSSDGPTQTVKVRVETKPQALTASRTTKSESPATEEPDEAAVLHGGDASPTSAANRQLCTPRAVISYTSLVLAAFYILTNS